MSSECDKNMKIKSFFKPRSLGEDENSENND